MKYPNEGAFRGAPEELKPIIDSQLEEKWEVIELFHKLTITGQKIGVKILLDPETLKAIEDSEIDEYLFEQFKKEDTKKELSEENTNNDINELKKIIKISKNWLSVIKEEAISILSENKEIAEYIKKIKQENKKEKIARKKENIKKKIKGATEAIRKIFSKKDTGKQ